MNDCLVRVLLDYLRPRQAEMVSFLEALVRAESPSVVPESQRAIQHLIREALENAGFRVKLIPGRGTSGGQLFASPQRRDRPAGFQLLIGHTDTVWPLGTLSKMPLEIEGERIKGPGVYDMKGGLVQLVFALKTLSELRIIPSVTPVVFLNSDEEIGSEESAPLISRISRRANRCFVLEPALGLTGKLKTARKGAGQFVINIEGRSAHAGLDPTAGASAIVELSYVIQKLQALNDPERGTSVNVGKIDGGIRPNVVAPFSTAIVDVRVPTEADGDRVEKAIRSLCPTTAGTRISVEGGMNVRPMEPTPRNRRLWYAAKDVGGLLGLKLEEGLAGGVSDGNTASQYTATLDGLGAVGDGAHAAHEYVDAHQMVNRCSLLCLLLLLPPLPGIGSILGESMAVDFPIDAGSVAPTH